MPGRPLLRFQSDLFRSAYGHVGFVGELPMKNLFDLQDRTLFVLRVGSVDDGRYVYRLNGWNDATGMFDCTCVARQHVDLDCFVDAPDGMTKASLYGDLLAERVYLTKHELLDGGYIYRLVDFNQHYLLRRDPNA